MPAPPKKPVDGGNAAAAAADNPPKKDEPPSGANLALWVAGSITVLTGLLTAFGGLTGGVARMIRNEGGIALAPLGLVVLGVVLALVADVLQGAWRTSLLVGSVVAAAGGLVWAVHLMVITTEGEDRPTLSAKVSRDSSGDVILTGTASASSMKSDGRLQVLVYVLAEGANSEQEALTEMRRLYFDTVGADQDGNVKQDFEIILPRTDPQPGVPAPSAYIVTASLGNLPRTCEEDLMVKVQAAPTDDTPETELAPYHLGKDKQRIYDVKSACVIIEPPQPQTTETETNNSAEPKTSADPKTSAGTVNNYYYNYQIESGRG